MKVFIDESGDLGKYRGSVGQTQYFTLAFVLTADSSRSANIIDKIVSDHGIKDELKFDSASDKVMRRFCENIEPLLEEEKVVLHSASVNTENFPEPYQQPRFFKQTIYQDLCRQLAVPLVSTGAKGPITVYLDRKWTKPKRQKDINLSIEEALEEQMEHNYSLSIEHVDSCREKNIQFADFIAGFSRWQMEGKTHSHFERLISPYSSGTEVTMRPEKYEVSP